MRFHYWGVEYEGFDHPYNRTVDNERAVEIPIALGWLPETGTGLEVGNVLAHYGLHDHRVVDLHEQGPGVENIDVMDVSGSYDWILSISTLEHTAEPVAALNHLLDLLKPKGRMLVTIPGGFNPAFDHYLWDGAGATRCCTLVRSDHDLWEQTSVPLFLPYGPWANSVWIGEWS